ncbi:MAG: porin family protein, partial [Holosporaceae bacterium]|nr:porin family protein [Holosporaceae bacterium]
MKKLILFTVIFGNAMCIYDNVHAIEDYCPEYSDSDYECNNDHFNRMFLGIGCGYLLDIDNATNFTTKNDVTKKISHIVGNLYFGSGRMLNGIPVYLGGELNMSLAKAASNTSNVNEVAVKFNHNGLVPSFGFRVGYSSSKNDLLFFGKIGLSHVKIKMEYENTKLSMSKLVPTIGLGMEKAISNKYSMRFDIEYIIRTDCRNDIYKLERGGTTCV